MNNELRLDLLLSQKLNISREKSTKLIKSGYVLYNNKPCKPSNKFIEGDFEKLTILDNDLLKYVSRGGLKLEEALNKFKIDVSNKTCIDVGASTGGFTHCLLINGATKVYAVDTGTLQMDNILRNDDRVDINENTNILDFECKPVNVIVIDVSFVSTTKIMPKILDFMDNETDVVLLLKPQFEVGKKYIGKNGVVKNDKIIIKTINTLTEFYTLIGYDVKNTISSPILGGSGNKEYLVHLRKA